MSPLCLALVLDICSRGVVGRTTGKRMTADLVLNAPNLATEQRKPDEVIIPPTSPARTKDTKSALDAFPPGARLHRSQPLRLM